MTIDKLNEVDAHISHTYVYNIRCSLIIDVNFHDISW